MNKRDQALQWEKQYVTAKLLREARIVVETLKKSPRNDDRRLAEGLSPWVKYGLEIGLQKVPRKGGK